MRRMEGVMATTHQDSEGDQLALEALESLVETIRRAYIPMWDEHDPRKPPIGRVASAEIRLRADGEHEVAAVIDIFEGNDSDESVDEREMVLSEHKPGLYIQPDRTFLSSADRADIEAISKAFGSKPTLAQKKAIDPLSILQIGGIFALGAFATGFLGKLGSDLADIVSEKVKKLMARKSRERNEWVLRFIFMVERRGHWIEIDTYLTNPTDEDIDAFFLSGIQSLDVVAPRLLDVPSDIRRVTFEFKDRNLHLRFAVRKDCVSLVSSGVTDLGDRDADA